MIKNLRLMTAVAIDDGGTIGVKVNLGSLYIAGWLKAFLPFGVGCSVRQPFGPRVVP